MARTSLYRHFDSQDRLLYVGISLRHLQRLSQHRDGSPWYWDIRRVDVAHYPNRASAERAERRAIRTECPLYNIVRVAPKPINSAVIDEILSLEPEKPQVWQFVGPSAPRRIGYLRLLPDADARAAAEAMVANRVDPSLVFVDDASRDDRPMRLRLLKTAQHSGTTIVCHRRSDFWDARRILRARGVQIECIDSAEVVAKVATRQNVTAVRASEARAKKRRKPKV